jgi:hypothetical protein
MADVRLGAPEHGVVQVVVVRDQIDQRRRTIAAGERRERRVDAVSVLKLDHHRKSLRRHDVPICRRVDVRVRAGNGLCLRAVQLEGLTAVQLSHAVVQFGGRLS